MSIDPKLLAQLNRMGTELERRARKNKELAGYYEGDCPFPPGVVRARMTHAYQLLKPMAEIPWGAIPVDSVQDRLEPIGIESPDKQDNEAVWGVWQDNAMDAESKLAHNSVLVDGRTFATVWREKGQNTPEIVLDDSSRMIILYADGSRRHRLAALRYWVEDDRPHATLYRPEAVYKLIGPKHSSGFSGVQWEERHVTGEPWPLPNPWKRVTVVELAVNRRLKAGGFPYARGEFAPYTGLIDRINLLTFLGLIVAMWMGFPLRGVIGQKLLKDDDGNPIPPFDADADSAFVLSNPDAKLAEYKAADRKNLAVVPELAQFAYLTKTPAHYFPLEAGLSNISADTIRALEGGLHAKVAGHKATLGEGWEEVLRLAGMMLDVPVQLSPRAALQWRDSESRSLAERADAYSKLTDLPWQGRAELALGLSQDQINRWAGQRAGDALGQLLNAAASTPTGPLAAAA